MNLLQVWKVWKLNFCKMQTISLDIYIFLFVKIFTISYNFIESAYNLIDSIFRGLKSEPWLWTRESNENHFPFVSKSCVILMVGKPDALIFVITRAAYELNYFCWATLTIVFVSYILFFILFNSSNRAAYKGFADTVRLLLFRDACQGRQDKDGMPNRSHVSDHLHNFSNKWSLFLIAFRFWWSLIDLKLVFYLRLRGAIISQYHPPGLMLFVVENLKWYSVY